MDIVLWVVAILLAIAFVGTGVGKLMTSKDKLYDRGMTYVEDFTSAQVKGIGVLEVLGAIGLIVPAFIDGVDFLVPTAATGVALLMIGSVITHVRRKETFIPPVILFYSPVSSRSADSGSSHSVSVADSLNAVEVRLPLRFRGA